jgi:hypothetical protein
LNRAFVRSSGAWIAWLNADEFYMPGGLRALLDVANSSDADVVYGTIAHVDEEGRFNGLGAQHRFNKFALPRVAPFIASCAMLVRRDALPPHPWDVGLRMTMDWDLYLTLAASGARFLHVPYPVAAFRSHPGQVTAGPGGPQVEIPQLLAKHSIDRSRVDALAGLAVHHALWAREGRFGRRGPARTLRGADMRWFREEVGDQAAKELIKRCYAGS